ncbi:hypothetical protein [Adhaeribacter aquaticus]|uniref:hypothetical protein n=1 Tax=Adhaeribacter aquaticus TaxID=299567 RepID=UPI00040036D6|nr:hypothetical protein [Adhaeribacter aquaticus]
MPTYNRSVASFLLLLLKQVLAPDFLFLALPQHTHTIKKCIGITIDKIPITTLSISLAPSTTKLGTVVVTGVSAYTKMCRNPVPTSVTSSQDLKRRTSTKIIDAIPRTPSCI